MVQTDSERAALALAGVARMVGASSQKRKGFRFGSQTGHMPRLPARSLVWVRAGGNQSMSLPHIHVSLSLHLIPSL